MEATTDRSLIELLEASPKFHEVLRDLKRLEHYMTEKEKQQLVKLVQEAMGCAR